MSKSISTNIDLSATKRKTFTIDNDENRTLSLNVSDLNIVTRLSTAQEKIDAVAKKSQDVLANTSDIGSSMAEIDKEMRDIIDYIFDAPVSAATAPDGSMFDIFDGRYRFEIIMETLFDLYETNIKAESEKIEKQMNKHTARYTKGK